jgi:8-oxo-dGTP pyrophosphatase MutT (NUDIX family)
MNATVTEIIARAVIRRDGQLLVARQRSAEAWSFLPGGHVEPGERIEVALLREITEELGINATIVGFLGAVEYGYVHGGVPHHELNLVFDVAIGDAETVSQEEHLEFHWLPFDQLSATDVRPRTLKDALKDALAATDADRTPFWRAWTG